MNSGYLKLQRNLLSQPDIIDMYSAEGATGLGLYVSINLYLSHCEGGWGAYTGTQMSVLAVEGHRHRSDVKRLITSYGLFVVDDEKKRFTSHWMQQQFGKVASKMQQSCGTPARTYNSHAEEIELEIKKENKEKCVRRKGTHSEFETLRAGRRYASHGQPLPADAPPQRRRNDMYSYIRHDWVPAEEFEKSAEMKVFHQLFNDDTV